MQDDIVQGRIVLTSADGGQGRIEAQGQIIYGPIPPQDGASLAIYERLIADGVRPEAYVPPAALVPTIISDRQFAQALALAGTITEGEALAWAARGELPQAMEEALDHIPDANGQRFGARMMLAAATSYERHLPLTEQLGGLLGYDAAALDALWTRAAAL
jgi:hypothetical protein